MATTADGLRASTSNSHKAQLPDSQAGDVAAKTCAQLNYYFSKKNLRRDRFLLSLVGPDGSGYVAAEKFENFNRLKSIVCGSGFSVPAAVLAAANISELLEVSVDGSSIRRRTPLQQQVSHVATDLQSKSLVTGQIPNIYWNAVTMEELRCNDSFLPLPPPRILQIEGPETWHWVRQDDPLWDELHWGVLSTRHLQGILGFREPQSIDFLGLPQHTGSHQAALSAYRDLSESSEAAARYPWRPHSSADAANKSSQAKWSAQHRVDKGKILSIASAKLQQQTKRSSQRRWTSIGDVRCAWGNAQEAAALKSILDAFPSHGFQMEEVGLAMLDPARVESYRPFEPVLDSSTTSQSSQQRRWQRNSKAIAEHSKDRLQMPPLMGASPDGMLRLPSGELAAVEVKNVCPFFQLPQSFGIHEHLNDEEVAKRIPKWQLKGPAEKVPEVYMPQVQWEMFVTDTQKNYFVSASAFQGTNIFIVERDERFIKLMLSFIAAFYSSFVLEGQPPPSDFFWGRSDYREFLELTQDICNRTPLSHTIVRSCRDDSRQAFLDTPPARLR
eukprot:TRINITY_DN15918_c0_g1_i1.p1 TRINITY_DN15918_c0_g1~~TRINITY_DN15918_c0_g1_i1.p1  ORF type:complete len:556 (+),score=62.37 TRINITY_DN15918_c0_g1_i1:100-1767(+)